MRGARLPAIARSSRPRYAALRSAWRARTQSNLIAQIDSLIAELSAARETSRRGVDRSEHELAETRDSLVTAREQITALQRQLADAYGRARPRR